MTLEDGPSGIPPELSTGNGPDHPDTESEGEHIFTAEEIGELLRIPNLTVRERLKDSEGKLAAIVFGSDEKETIDGVECEITYTLTLPGQRYKTDGSPGRMVSATFLSRDYGDGPLYSEELASFVDGEWVVSAENNTEE